MFAATKAFSTFGRRDLGDPFWANVSLLVQPPSLAGGTNKTFVDSSANGFAVTAVGDVYQSADSPVPGGGSAVFDGSGDYLEIPNSSAFHFPDDFTLEAWIRPSDTTGRKNIISLRQGGTVGLHFRVDGTDLDLNYGDTNLLTAANSISANTWQHVAVCRSGSTLRVFVDGVVKADRTWTTSATTTAPIRVGMLYNPTDQAFAGEIADARIVKGTAVYTANFTVPTAPLTAVSGTSLLLNMSNGKILDKSPQSNSITLVGDAQTSTATPLDGMGSVTFDGSGDRLTLPGGSEFVFGTGDFTIEMWFRPTDLASSNVLLIDFRPSGTNGVYPTMYVTTDGKLHYQTQAINRITHTGISENVWYHLALCRFGTETKMFLDGTQVGETYTDTLDYSCPTDRPVIGANGWNLGLSNYEGQIADLRITKGVARYTAAFTPPTKPLPAVGPANQITALGGTITDIDGYRIHTFTTSGTFTVASNPKLDPVEYLIVAGGGGGGATHGGGGGGAGGYRCSVAGESSGGGASAESPLTLPAGSYTVTVGAGGSGAATRSVPGGDGQNSLFHTIVATGGGGGGTYGGHGRSGGSGGGGSTQGGINGGAGTANQGYKGGNTIAGVSNRGGAGGGGAGQQGYDQLLNIPDAADGGDGVTSSITGTAVTRAGGGGGAAGAPEAGAVEGSGGSGGGGNGGNNSTLGTDGAANTGGGGGGGGWSGGSDKPGRAGGSGIVIIRYPI